MYFWGLYQGGISYLNVMEEETNYEGCGESRPGGGKDKRDIR
jgi:hypothetical protein